MTKTTRKSQSKKQNQPTIKMVAFNPITRKYETVFPEDEVPASKLIPMFWTDREMKWVTVPDVKLEDVYSKWVAQY